MKNRIKDIILSRIKLYGHRSSNFAYEDAARIIYETFIEDLKKETQSFLVELIEVERGKVSRIDGYNYNSGVEYGLRLAQMIIEKNNDIYTVDREYDDDDKDGDMVSDNRRKI